MTPRNSNPLATGEPPGKAFEPDVLSHENLEALAETADGLFAQRDPEVVSVRRTPDRTIEFVSFRSGKVLAHVRSKLGYPAYYPLHSVRLEKPVKAVLMDLDGTTVHSEAFWIGIIQKTMALLLEDPGFVLKPEDLPFVSGHSVSEHLLYCIRTYCPHKTVEEARSGYYHVTRVEMEAVLQGSGLRGAFRPAPGIKEFLLTLKAHSIKIALVTSGLYEKAWPEILDAFRTLGLGDPAEFYDTIITAGHALRPREPGTLGELCPKPHPWLYAEAARVGLGIPFEERHHVVGIEDSGAGVMALRLAGFPVIGVTGGNLSTGGMDGFCHAVCQNFEEVLPLILP